MSSATQMSQSINLELIVEEVKILNSLLGALNETSKLQVSEDAGTLLLSQI